MRIRSTTAGCAVILLAVSTIICAADKKAESLAPQASAPMAVKDAKAGFQTDLSALRKQVIGSCGQFMTGKPRESKEQLLAEIDAVIARWNIITETYRDNPPAEYAKDPAWKGYFETALDNFQVMRAKAEAGNYHRAMEFCGMNCGLFITMNQVNGIDKVSDRMFMLRKTIKQAVEMLSAGNHKGALETAKQADAILTKLSGAQPPAGVSKDKFDADVRTIKEAFTVVRGAIDSNDAAAAGSALKAFIKAFGEVYMQYV